MRAYYGSRISPNQTKTTDGFLVAHNVPISRTGWHKYLGHEVGLPHSDVVDVYRDPQEVFSPAAIASYEGKPLTDGHPMDGVNPDNAQIYARGVTQNVRQGKGDEEDLLLADLVVWDKMLQEDIKNGKREVSSGYEYDLVPNDDGSYSQKNIVGNHVAVVPDGRAGPRVRIKDARSVEESGEMTNEEAARKYGIAMKKDGHRTPPEGYPADREQYADPVNFKYPLNGAHAHDAIDYYNRPGERTKGDYTSEEWEKIGRRIVDKLGTGYALKDGHIVTPDERAKKEARDHMPKKIKLPLPKRSRVTDFLAAVGLKQYAMDAEPEEIRDAVDEMVKERAEDETGNDFPVPTVNETKATDSEGGNAAAAEEIDDLKKQLAEMRAMLDKAMKGKADDEDPEKKIDDAIAQMENPEGATGNEEESHSIDPTLIADENGVIAPPDERPQNGFTAMDRAARVSALRALKPVIAAIPDPVQRKKAADQAIAAIMAPPKNNTYAQIAGGARKTASDKRAASAAQRQDESQLGREWAKQRNPHYKERA